jgi:hypothetical protein
MRKFGFGVLAENAVVDTQAKQASDKLYWTQLKKPTHLKAISETCFLPRVQCRSRAGAVRRVLPLWCMAWIRVARLSVAATVSFSDVQLGCLSVRVSNPRWWWPIRNLHNFRHAVSYLVLQDVHLHGSQIMQPFILNPSSALKPNNAWSMMKVGKLRQ